MNSRTSEYNTITQAMEANQDDVHSTSGMPDSIGKSSILCRVCGDRSTGVHYGVSTCNACKSFFHRTLRFHSQYECRGNKNCNIRNSKRKPCPWCRLKRCLEVGMTKEGMNKRELHFKLKDNIHMAGKQSHKPELLPPCYVCQDRASGFHYGVNSCNACKGFFHRALQFNSRYRCIGSGNCDIRHGTGTVCKKCRYRKCLDVGMSKLAIKTGRKKRRKDIPEVKVISEVMASSISNTQESYINSYGTSFDIGYGSDNQQSQSSSSEMDQQDNMGKGTASPLCFSSYTMPADDEKVRLAAAGTPPNTKSIFSTSSHNPNSEQVLTDSTSTLYRNVGPCQSPKSEKHAIASTSVPASKSGADGNLICNEAEERVRIMELYTNEEAVLRSLMDAERNCFDDYAACYKVFKASRDHFESCKAHKEIFGKLIRVPDEEHERIFRETGIDVDGRQKFATEYEKTLEDFIRKMCTFCRAIPGFTNLHLPEKISLIQMARLECSLLCNYPVANIELGVIRTHGHKWICLYDDNKFQDFEKLNWRHYLNICKRFQGLNLCLEERVLLKAVSLTNPDHCKAPTSSLHLIHKNLSRLLVKHIGKCHENPQMISSEIKDILTHFRLSKIEITCLIKNLNLNKYSLVKRKLARFIVPDLIFGNDDISDGGLNI